jgi:hypothetical protein
VEIVIAAGALAMSALFFVLAGQFPKLAADPGGLALFPRIVAAVTGLASAAFFVQAVLRRAPLLSHTFRPASLSVAGLLDGRGVAVAIFAFVLLLPFAIQALGFVAAIFVFTTLVLAVSRVKLIPLALTTVLTTVAIYIAYAIILGAVLPSGYLLQ